MDSGSRGPKSNPDFATIYCRILESYLTYLCLGFLNYERDDNNSTFLIRAIERVS